MLRNVKKHHCPNCKKETSLEASNPYRPFCSDRCKLIDLGNWASEHYSIPTEEKISNEPDNEGSH